MEKVTITIPQAEIGTLREAALKPLEEAAEVYGAWQSFQEVAPNDLCRKSGFPQCDCEHKNMCETYLHPDQHDILIEMLADEIADCMQACANLAYRYGIDLQSAIDRCERRNHERGRY